MAHMSTNENILLSVKDLKVYFRSDEELARAVDGVSFNVRREETVCLVGESGCGKTLTALSVLGLIPSPPGEIAGGRILFNRVNLLDLTEAQLQKIRGNQIAMVFQEPLSSLNPVFTVGDQIKEAIRTHENSTADELEARCIQLLKSVGIPAPADRIDDYPHQLSGGQRQRVMIAMALACNPALVIADEPTTALDVTVQSQILNLFATLQKTLALLASVPHRSKRGQRLFSISGSVPNPAYKPAGCPFHPRCPEAIEACRLQFPQMCDYGHGHLARCPVVYEGQKNRGDGVLE
jgi:oligopeptide/dipeptide ABC transporter ATP-binding protein